MMLGRRKVKKDLIKNKLDIVNIKIVRKTLKQLKRGDIFLFVGNWHYIPQQFELESYGLIDEVFDFVKADEQSDYHHAILVETSMLKDSEINSIIVGESLPETFSNYTEEIFISGKYSEFGFPCILIEHIDTLEFNLHKSLIKNENEKNINDTRSS